VNSQRSVATTVLAALGLAGAAHAAHPLATEDTGTQGAGNVEFENGLSRARSGGTRVVAYQPQLSYGSLPALDVIVQPVWLSSKADGAGTVRGLGDTNVDVKWRFSGAAPLSLGVRAGVMFATSQHGLGLPHGDVSPHALLVATYDAAPYAVHGNVGVTYNPQNSGSREWVGRVSGALMWAGSEQLTLTAEVEAQANADPARKAWQGAWLAGVIYTIRPGLDLDGGFQGLGGSLRGRTWLVGVTYRFGA
jgi:hypothetical protein